MLVTQRQDEEFLVAAVNCLSPMAGFRAVEEEGGRAVAQTRHCQQEQKLGPTEKRPAKHSSEGTEH